MNCDINSQTIDKQTPLHLAAMRYVPTCMLHTKYIVFNYYPCILHNCLMVHTVGSWSVVSGWWPMRPTSLPKTTMKGLLMMLQRFIHSYNVPVWSQEIYYSTLSPKRRITIKKLHTIWWAMVRLYFQLPLLIVLHMVHRWSTQNKTRWNISRWQNRTSCRYTCTRWYILI